MYRVIFVMPQFELYFILNIGHSQSLFIGRLMHLIV